MIIASEEKTLQKDHNNCDAVGFDANEHDNNWESNGEWPTWRLMLEHMGPRRPEHL